MPKQTIFECDKLIPIGGVAVDSGQIIIIDPCYLGEWDKDKDYNESCETTLEEPDFAGPVFKNLAVASTTAFGDGVYPVYKVMTNGEFQGIFIDFQDFFGIEDKIDEDE